MTAILYPFSAILGQDAMKTALLVNAVDPTIGGVLIRGQKGTGKSTAARALAALLPEIEVVTGCPCHCAPDDPATPHAECAERLAAGEIPPRTRRPMPVVDLPLSATEDRVVGALHLEHALKTGQRRFEPGLLAAANRGILCVDEVNLLADHLVDLLLDAAASGVNLVEREGLCYRHPARFMLVGTMNPEEGELRPQFLDRFGLCVTVRGLDDPSARREVVTRRLVFEADPAAFLRQWADEERLLAGQVELARERREAVVIPEPMLDLAVRLAIEVGAHGHRADLAIIKTARALAALLEKPAVTAAEIAEAARLALPHRMARSPLDSDASLDDRLDGVIGRLLAGEEPEAAPEIVDKDIEILDEMTNSMEVPGATAAGSILFAFLKKKVRKPSSRPMPISI
jgi:Mg-chelatase subunit ChlI